jgi:UTP-glucose-1-phosphate uridylyltransferase
MHEITLLVLAAGIGKRYRGLKQIDSVGPSGEMILDYSLYDAIQAGFSRVVFVIRKQIEKLFRQAIGSYWEGRVSVEYVFQEIESGLPGSFPVPGRRQKPWGTAHAVLVSRAAVHSPFVVINADDFYGPSAYRDLSAWLKKSSSRSDSEALGEYAFVGYRLNNTLSDFGYVSRGICTLDDKGYLSEVVERLKIERDGEAARTLDENGRWIKLSGDEIVSLNFWGFTPTLFSHLEKGFAEFLRRAGQNAEAEYFIPFAVNELVRSGKARVKYLPTSEKWFGVTYPEDVPPVRLCIQGLIREGIYPEKIRK